MTREELLARAGLVRTAPVKLPEWGEDVHVKELSQAEIDECFAVHLSHAEQEVARQQMYGRLVVYCACRSDGTPIFTKQDAEAVGKMPAKEVARVYRAAMRLNKVGEDDAEKIEKNS